MTPAPDGGALQNYADALPDPDRALFLEDLRRYLATHLRGYRVRIRRAR